MSSPPRSPTLGGGGGGGGGGKLSERDRYHTKAR
jgi:hypothetical protein